MERKILNKKKQSFRVLCKDIKQSNICVIGDAEEETKNGAEKLNEDILDENYQNGIDNSK